MYNLENYYLDLEKVSKLETEDERNRIHSYYMDMLVYSSEKRNVMSKSLFHTLWKNGYLKEIRDEKLKEILEEDV